MSTLRVNAGGRAFTFEEPRVVTVGRAAESDIVLTVPTASRRHAEIRSDGDGWTVVDVGSTSGTFLNGTRVNEVRVSGRTSVRFGAADGEEVSLLVEGAAQQPAFPVPNPAAVPVGMEQTVIPGHGPAAQVPGPYGAPAPAGPGILVRVGDESKRFAPGTVVRIGRDPANEVVLDDPSVSRLHATLETRQDGWWFFDRSTAGTYDEEDRVTQRRLEAEPTTLMLGHPTAGVEVELVPIVAAGEAQRALASKKRKRTALVLTAIAAAFVLVVGGLGLVWWLGNDDDNTAGPSQPTAQPDELSDAALDRAKQASVFIVAADANGTPIYTGSGSIISDDGLILTNAHVGKPSAPGEPEPQDDPAILAVALTSPEDDKPVELAYRAEPLVADGVLDLAVLKITQDIDGNPVDASSLDLPDPLPIGVSDDLRTGDEITALGFPALASAELDDPLKRALTVTRGVVSTFEGDSMLDTDRAWIDSDIRIGSGNSGGASINNAGELVGVNSAVITESTSQGSAGSFTGGSALIRPVDLAKDLIDIAEKGGDPNYTSPYLEAMSNAPTDVPSSATIDSAGWSPDGAATCEGSSSLDDPQTVPKVAAGTTIYAEYLVQGVEDGTPVSVTFLDTRNKEVGSLADRWKFGSDQICITVPFTVPGKLQGVLAEITIGSLTADDPLLFK